MAAAPASATAASQCTDLAPLANPNPFRWELVEEEPKVIKRCLTRAHRTMEYHILHTGGFLRLCTDRGRIYWLAQNEHDHRPPDWKIHFSVHPEDLPTAWDVLTRVFMDRACDFGMKAVSGEALARWPPKQYGRELTVYVFQHDPSAYGTRGGPMEGLWDAGSEHNFWLGPEFERESAFWWGLVREAEAALAEAGVRSHGGVAAGDLALGGPYASLRNEAFVLGREPHMDVDGYVYPPNEAGWNAARHACPLQLPPQIRWRAAAADVRCRLGCGRRRRR